MKFYPRNHNLIYRQRVINRQASAQQNRFFETGCRLAKKKLYYYFKNYPHEPGLLGWFGTLGFMTAPRCQSLLSSKHLISDNP